MDSLQSINVPTGGAPVSPNKPPHPPRLGGLLGPFLIGVIAAGMMLVATTRGASLSSDSLIYLNSSRNLVQGHGITRLSGPTGFKPITHYPPFFPLMLAGLQLLGLGVSTSARVVSTLAFGATAALTVVAVRAFGGGRWSSLIAGLFVAVSPVLVDIYSWAMSESIYLVFGLLAMLVLGAYRHNRSILFLVTAALAASLAYLSRYIGLSLVGAGALVVAVEAEVPLARRLRHAGLYLLVGLAPTGAWMVRNLVLTGYLSNYSLVFHPPSLSVLKKPLAVLWEWLVPFPFTHASLIVVVGAICLLLVGIVFWALRGHARPVGRLAALARGGGPLAFLLVYLVTYTTSVALSIAFLGITIPVDQRLACPVYLSALILTAAGLSVWLRSNPAPALKVVVLMLAVALGLSYVFRTSALVGQLVVDSRGYAGTAFQAAGDVPFVKRLPEQLIIYSNSFPALEFFYDKGSYMVPLPGDPVTGLPVEAYGSMLDDMRRAIHAGRAVMVLFFREPGDGQLPVELGEGLVLLCRDRGVSLYVGENYSGPTDCGA
jgi:hypothetical protein